jgi:IQ motif/SEC7 domain-containing protein
MNEMETLRIEEELQKQKLSQSQKNFNRHSKDSGVVDIELLKPTDPSYNRLSAPECGGIKKTALSNSLIDLSESMCNINTTFISAFFLLSIYNSF